MPECLGRLKVGVGRVVRNAWISVRCRHQVCTALARAFWSAPVLRRFLRGAVRKTRITGAAWHIPKASEGSGRPARTAPKRSRVSGEYEYSAECRRRKLPGRTHRCISLPSRGHTSSRRPLIAKHIIFAVASGSTCCTVGCYVWPGISIGNWKPGRSFRIITISSLTRHRIPKTPAIYRKCSECCIQRHLAG